MKASFRLSTSVSLALLIGLLALAGQWSSYRVSAQVLEATVREREIDKINAVGTVIKASIQEYGDKAKLVARLKASDDVVAEGLKLSGPERTATLAKELDEVFRISELQVLEVIDTEQRVVYRAQDPGRTGDQATGWGVAEALSGADTLVSSRGPEGVSIRNISPVRGVGGAVIGAISAGVGLNHQAFIDRVSLQAGAKLALLGRKGEVLAGQAELALPESGDDSALTEVFENRLPVYRSDASAHHTRVYLPLTIVDDWYVMVAQIDSSDAYALIASGTRRSAVYALLILLGSLFIGFLALRAALNPLRQLRRRAEQTALALTGQTIHVHGSDEVASVVKVLDTLTDRLVQHNNELLAAKNQADAASHAKSQFLSAMSHEIRTPLNGVLGMAELLQHTRLDTDQSRYVGAIASSGRALHALLGDILDLAKVEEGQVQLEHTDFDLASLLSEISDVYRELASTRGLLLVSELQATGAWVNGDPGRLRQVVSNLLGNAIKFTEHGEVRLRSENLPARAGDTRTWQRFTVEDTGLGIAGEAMDKLFQRFAQADDSTTRKFGGSGLGLVICKHLVELMGGNIQVHSAPGQGARFWFDLPFDPAKAPHAAAQGAPKALHHAGARILLAEDNLVNQQVIKGLLGHLGATVTVADNGELALAQFCQGRFDLVVMDCQMPVMDGFEAARRIRAWEQNEPGRSPVPIVALTANALAGDREACLAAGMSDYLTKPATMASLAKTLWRNLPDLWQEPASPLTPAAGQVDTAAAFDPSVVNALPMVADGSDVGFADQILALFVEGAKAALDAIAQAVCDGDLASLTLSVHTLKSSAAQVGAMALSAEAERQELLLRAGAPAQANWPALLRQAFDGFELALGRHRQAVGPLQDEFV